MVESAGMVVIWRIAATATPGGRGDGSDMTCGGADTATATTAAATASQQSDDGSGTRPHLSSCLLLVMYKMTLLFHSVSHIAVPWCMLLHVIVHLLSMLPIRMSPGMMLLKWNGQPGEIQELSRGGCVLLCIGPCARCMTGG